MNASVSARKIGANLWEVQPQLNYQKLDDDDDDDDGGGLFRQRHHRFERGAPLGSDRLQHHNNSQPVITYSTHLLKVLQRILTLEEQHSRDTVLIKSLKRDLDISRAQIKTLVEERKRDHQEIKELKRSTHERKEKVVQSKKDELLEVKYVFMREKKARILLESLCDEFAKGVRDYEQKVRFLQHNRRGKDQIVSRDKPDRLIYHVSEAWLDERVQINCDFAEKMSISDNLCRVIETFLEVKKKQFCGSGIDILDDCEGNRSCGVLVEPSSQLVSKMIDRDPGPTDPSWKSMPRTTDQCPGVTESSSQPFSRTVQALGFDEPSTRRARVGVKANTLMVKLLEARLESQFSKSTRARR